MTLLGSVQIGLLADGIFELLGPIFIFGVYAIAAIAKKWAKSSNSGGSEGSGEELGSELKNAVQKRYQQIYERQIGKTPTAPPKFVRTEKVQNTGQAKPRQVSQWDRQQQMIRQQQERLQKQQALKRNPLSVPVQKTQQHRYTPVQQPKPQSAIPKPVKAKVSKAVRPATKVAKKESVQVPEVKSSSNHILKMIKSPENLRSAIILKEILDKPIGLREI